MTWWEWSRFQRERFATPLLLAFAFVATHNHFVLDRGGKVFNRSAPVIKLPEDASEDDQFALLGLLNSSTGCFWMKQVFFPKGGSGMGRGIQPEDWMERYEHDGTKLQEFPVVQMAPIALARRLDAETKAHGELFAESPSPERIPSASVLAEARDAWRQGGERLIALQEELDWWCYRAYDLLDEDLTHDLDTLPGLELGQRAFEIVLARQVAAGEVKTAWFQRHGSTPIAEIPSEWPETYRRLVERRIELIETDRDIGLIERPEYKRRWSAESWEAQVQGALESWLKDRLEREDLWQEPRITTVARLADELRRDAHFMRVGELYRDDPDFDVTRLVAELVAEESAPFLPALRYKPSGLEKRRRWERTWELQRQEDAIDARTELPKGDPDRVSRPEAAELKAEKVGEIPVPPKYASRDFRKSSWWRLRGKLDVPKERFVSYPGCERESDASLPIAWAGWDHLQQARALSGYYVEMKNQEGWSPERLTPLLAGLLELVPWLKQWHDEPDPEFGVGMGTYFAGFVDSEARTHGLTLEHLLCWRLD